MLYKIRSDQLLDCFAAFGHCTCKIYSVHKYELDYYKCELECDTTWMRDTVRNHIQSVPNTTGASMTLLVSNFEKIVMYSTTKRTIEAVSKTMRGDVTTCNQRNASKEKVRLDENFGGN